MSPAATLCAAVALAAGVSFAVVELRGTSSRALLQDDASALQNDLAALQTEVAALRADLAAQTRMSAAPPISASPEASARTAVPTVSDAQIAAAVDRYLASLGDKLPAEAAALRAADPKATFAELRSNASFWESGGNGERYKKIFAAGKMDELIAQFEQAAEADPRNAQAQMDLANAYLAYVQVDNAKYEYSMKADGVFDQILALDENHWEARFTKAMSYTFWPEFLGKKKEAIAHFEHLVDQQDAMPVAEHEAQTYLILGNLLEQREPERAREIWERGLRRHPGNAELLAKLGK